MSFVEFVGCLAALGGGVVIGSIYLGVDVKAMAVGILEKADIEVPAILNADTPANEESAVSEVPTTDATETSVETADEPAAPSQDDTTTDDETASESPEPKELTAAEQLAATQACWSILDESVREESTNRSKTISDPQSWQLFDYLLHRKQGHEKVVEVIEQLDQHGVDPRLQIHVRQVLAWHKTGTELYDRAAQLLTDAPAGKLTGPFAQSWQSAATQHRMEEKLILNKHTAVASYLEHSYKASAVAHAE